MYAIHVYMCICVYICMYVHKRACLCVYAQLQIYPIIYTYHVSVALLFLYPPLSCFEMTRRLCYRIISEAIM